MSESIDKLSDGAEAFCARLITVADDFGRFLADPRLLLAATYPLRAKTLSVETIEERLGELVKAEMVALYSVDGKQYGHFLNFERHNGRRAKNSKFPSPDENTCEHVQADASTRLHMSPRSEKREARIETREARSESRSRSFANGAAAPSVREPGGQIPEGEREALNREARGLRARFSEHDAAIVATLKRWDKAGQRPEAIRHCLTQLEHAASKGEVENPAGYLETVMRTEGPNFHARAHERKHREPRAGPTRIGKIINEINQEDE